MIRRRSIVFVCVLAGLVGRSLPARGQELALAPRKPLFIAAWGQPGRAVDLNQAAVLWRRVSLDLTNVPVDTALRVIARDAGLELAYTRGAVPSERRVSIHAQGITVASALTEVLLGMPVDVAVGRTGQLAIVRAAEPAVLPALPTGAIVGRVADGKTGATLAGATVLVDGTKHSGSTGNDGRYRIADVPPGTYTVRARYIGYTPGSASVTVAADQEATADFGLDKSAQRLDEVVTTGTVVPTEVKALPAPITIVTGDEMVQKGYHRVDQIFRGDVPGSVTFDWGPGLDYFTLTSIRGASAFGGSTIKTFIDGVELADPSLMTTIDPNSIERVEVTRGPQASTLYGAGALDGVMQIFTKKGNLGLTRPTLAGRVSAGGIGGYDGHGSAFQTDNTMSIAGGNQTTSYSLGGSYRQVGEWIPLYGSTDWSVSTGGETTQGRFTLAGSARYAQKAFDKPWDTRLQVYQPFSQPSYETDRLTTQTYGATATLRATSSWRHVLTLGYDQSYLNYYQTQPSLTTPADSLLYSYAYTEGNTSLLYHTDLTLRLGRAVTATTSAGVNHYWYNRVGFFNSGATRTTGNLDGSSSTTRTPWTNTGYFGQVQLAVLDRVYLTGGLRAERNPNFGSDAGTAWSPRAGIAYVASLGPAAVKLRGSYGESIRAPGPDSRESVQRATFQILANPGIGPERQRGGDGGIDLYFGQRASLGVTYFNQRAIDLIQLVFIPTAPGTLFTYQWQNIGRVKNDGWELEGRVDLGRLQAGATYSIVNSTIAQLPPGYVGDYRIGDRVLGVPHRSAGATLSYAPFSGTTFTASMTYIGRWTELDNLALYGAFYGGDTYRGTQRDYWLEYPTVTKFSVGASQSLTKYVSAFVRAENLGNTLRYEENNTNIPTPRAVVVGGTFRY